MYIEYLLTVKQYWNIAVRKRKRETLVQTGLRLEAGLLNRLRNSGRGLSDEIRDRLERTFKNDSIDPVTRELCDGLVNVAERLRDDFGAEWHAWPLAYQAFAAAIAQRIVAYAPPPGVMEDAAADLLGPNYPPETLGRIREQDDQRAHVYQHLAAAQKLKKAGFAKHVRTKKEGKDE
jgi:hypothetical protein